MTTALQSSLPPCVLHEDEHLLVVNKPAGWNTHAPSPFAGEGIYDWLKHREPRWANLAIIHRLDKETSGVMVFGKTPLANRSLTEQFARRTVRKQYLLLADRQPKREEFIVRTQIARLGERYASCAHGEPAETRFRFVATDAAGQHLVEAEPLTGRTHQIRVHAAEQGFPIIGDVLYGGVDSQRICLHAQKLTFQHPAGGQQLAFEMPTDFSTASRDDLRGAFIEAELTNAFRLTHGAGDGPQLKGWYADRLGDFLLSAIEGDLGSLQGALEWWRKKHALRGVYRKELIRSVRQATSKESSARLLLGDAAPERFNIRENGVQFELSFNEGYSVGLFLDQRDNRRRLLTSHVAANFPLRESKIRNSKFEILNCFAYTCGFSVCAALAGARTTSLDLSKKYLEWGKRNFALNGLDSAAHEFIYGDAFDWLKRLAKKGRAFDGVILDPPTFSQSKESGVFRVEKDFGKLVKLALSVLKPGGVLFASSNAADWPPENFLVAVRGAVDAAGRRIAQEHYVPQPPDFPISRAEPAYLKTVWLRVVEP
ncbi:MAG: class I SAM-dependent methyltransferase [Verrucomicrobia bacterium]|nr:class I SAM-dependent methyltransferase [Verrucomicrobiota bacterium]